MYISRKPWKITVALCLLACSCRDASPGSVTPDGRDLGDVLADAQPPARSDIGSPVDAGAGTDTGAAADAGVLADSRMPVDGGASADAAPPTDGGATPGITATLASRTASPSGSGPAPETVIKVVPGLTYRIRVSGTFHGGEGYPKAPWCLDYIADARYHTCSTAADTYPWRDAAPDKDFRGAEHFQLQLWNEDTSRYETGRWDQPYNLEHTYTRLWTATGNQLRLRIDDPDGGDNEGVLSLELTPVSCGGAGQPCCPEQRCGLGTVCAAQELCVLCGGAGQPACQESCQTLPVAAFGTAAATVRVQAGQTYQLATGGTYEAGNGLPADAQYRRDAELGWVHAPAALQLWDDRSSGFLSLDWGAFNITHRYSLLVTAGSDTLQMRLHDPGAGEPHGALGLTVCPAACGTAGQPCCSGRCIDGAFCDGGEQCQACGAPGQPQCPGACITRMLDPRLVPGDGDSCPAALQLPVSPGITYRIIASGTVQVRDDTVRIVADARYSSVADGPWSDTEDGGDFDKGASFLDLQLRSGSGPAVFRSPDWGPYNPEHRYSTLWQAESDVLCLRVNDDLPGDNGGALRVEVCPVNWPSRGDRSIP